MDGILHKVRDRCVNEAVAGQQAKSVEIAGNDADGVVPAAACARMTDVGRAVIANLKGLRLERLGQACLEGLQDGDGEIAGVQGRSAGGALAFWASRESQNAWASTKTRVMRVSPITLKLTQVRSEKLRATRMFATPSRA